jgi:iron complex transport system substrate-binding protein
VSLNPCSDAILAQVARPGQLLAVSNFSHRAASSSMGVAEASRFPQVGASVEEIAALAPDVVVSDVFLPPATQQALLDLGIAVVTIGNIDSVTASEAQVRQLAQVAKNPAAGEQLVSRIEAALAAAQPAAGSKTISTIVWEAGGIVAGDKTLIADLLSRTGFANAAAARGLRQADYMPLEAMVVAPPQLILAAGSGQSSEDRLLSHPALAALKDTRRVSLDSNLLWCGGPTIIRAAQRLQEIRRGLPSV